MAINHIDIATSLNQVNQVIRERHTEPLQAIKLYSALAQVEKGKDWQRVYTPGIVQAAQDQDFAAGVYFGRCMYFEAVDVMVDAEMGEVVECFTLEDIEAGRVKPVKQFDITTEDVLEVIGEAREEDVNPAFHAGLVVGYIQAASDCYFGQACDHCGLHVQFCPGHPGQ